MEIELIQNYINDILSTNNILDQVRVYSDTQNVIKISPFSVFSTIYYQNVDKFKQYILNILTHVIETKNLSDIDIDIDIEIRNDTLIINIVKVKNITSLLPMEDLTKILYDSNYNSIKSFCFTNKAMKQICDDPTFWRSKYIYDYGMIPPNFINDVDKDFYAKLGYLYDIDNQVSKILKDDKIFDFTIYKSYGMPTNIITFIIDDKFDSYAIINNEKISLNMKLKYISYSNIILLFINIYNHIRFIEINDDHTYDDILNLFNQATKSGPIINVEAKYANFSYDEDKLIMMIIDMQNRLWITFDAYEVEFKLIMESTLYAKLNYIDHMVTAKDTYNNLLLIDKYNKKIMTDSKFYWGNYDYVRNINPALSEDNKLVIKMEGYNELNDLYIQQYGDQIYRLDSSNTYYITINNFYHTYQLMKETIQLENNSFVSKFVTTDTELINALKKNGINIYNTKKSNIYYIKDLIDIKIVSKNTSIGMFVFKHSVYLFNLYHSQGLKFDDLSFMTEIYDIYKPIKIDISLHGSNIIKFTSNR